MKRILITAALAVGAATLAAQTPASPAAALVEAPPRALAKITDWPQWRGPARDGIASSLTIPTVWPAQLTKRWQATVGLGHASPVIAGTRVIVHARQGNRETVAAYELASGKQLWQDGIDVFPSVSPAAIAHGPGPKSTPAVANGRVFTLGITGILSAHDLSSGKLLWRIPEPTVQPDFGTATSPLVDGANVIAFLGGIDAGALTALDAATGATRWRWMGDGPGYASPIIATIGGVRQLVTQSQTKLIGIGTADGKLLWSVPFKTPFEQNSVTPVVVNDMIICAGLDTPTVAYSIRAVPGHGWQPTPRWRNDQITMYMSSPAVSGNTVFGLSNRNRGQFFALDATTGKTLWLGKGREAENASIARAGTYLLLATTNSELIVAKASAAAFEEVKRYTVADAAMWAHPAFAGRNIIVKDVDQLIAWSY